MTRCASDQSPFSSARTASLNCVAANSPMVAMWRVSAPRSSSKAFTIWGWLMSTPRSGRCLTETAGNVVLGLPVGRPSEEIAGGAELDELAEEHEAGELRHARRL